MHQKYIDLFKEISKTTEVLAERVMEYNHTKKDEKGEKTAETMRNDFASLRDKFEKNDFDPTAITKAEYAKLLVGSMIIINNIEDRIANEKKAIEGYKLDLLPKLQRIVNECKTEEETTTLATELFTIKETSTETNN